MATLGVILGGIGAGISGGALPASSGAAMALVAASAATTATTTGLAIAQAAGAFDPDTPDPDAAPEVDPREQRMNRLADTESTLLAGETGVRDTAILSDVSLGPTGGASPQGSGSTDSTLLAPNIMRQ